MRPKEKAEELVDRFYPRATSYASDRKNQIENAKECALIAVDEILNSGKDVDEFCDSYWQEVKQEIQKL